MRRLLLLLVLFGTARGAEELLVPSLPRGVTEETQTAIRRGLGFLAQQQNGDGSWRSSGHTGSYPCAMSGLAGLALIASGSTPTRGPYAKQVALVVKYLIEQQQSSGLIASTSEEGRTMYGHGFALLLLAQVYGMEEDAARQAKLQYAIRKAIELTARAQSGRGGWYYNPEDNQDEGSVTVTQVQALRACRNAGFHVPKRVIDNAVSYIEKSQEPDGGIAYSVDSRGSRPAISAAACAVLYNAGAYLSKAVDKAWRYAWDHCRPNMGGEGHWFYTQLYMSQATWQTGDKLWGEYYPQVRDRLLPLQQGNGSWNDSDRMGTVYGTAIALLILQIPFQQLPILSR